MRLLIISQYFWPESFRINQVAESLSANGCEVYVLTGQPNYPDGNIFKGYKSISIKREKMGEVNIIRIPLIPRKSGSSLFLFLNYFSFVISGLFVAPFLLKKLRFDSIFVYAVSPLTKAIPAIFLKWLYRIPLVIWVGDLWPESLSSTGHIKNKNILNLVSIGVRFIYSQTDKILVQSKGFIQDVQKLAPNKEVLYLPNPENRISLEKNLENNGYKLNGKFKIVFAGNLGSVQALDSIMDCAELLKGNKEIHFTLVGSGSRVEWLKKNIVERSLKNVTLAGRFDPQFMPAILYQADALLVTLIKDELMAKTVPSKLQTYMSIGKPIIAGLEGSGAKIVKEANCGVLVDVSSPKNISEEILHLSKLDGNELDILGQNGLSYFEENFAINRITNKLKIILAGIQLLNK
jgi:glycosyltransferase involved in cell wall biosynthesis